MPRLKVVGDLPRAFKGLSIRLDEGAGFRMDVTPTQGSSGPNVGAAETESSGEEPTPQVAVQGEKFSRYPFIMFTFFFLSSSTSSMIQYFFKLLFTLTFILNMCMSYV